MKALVVDDNEINRILASRLLSKAGWTVAEVEDGEHALSWLRDNSVELVLLDVSMPTMSGEEVCQHIRQDSLGGPGVKVLAYTAHAMTEQQEQFLACGFDAVLLKPLSRASLTATLLGLGFGTAEPS